MIIWNGWGWSVAAITFAGLVLAELFVENLFRDDQFYQSHGWPKLVGFVVAALAVFLVGRLLQRQRLAEIGREPAKEAGRREPDKLFFIELKYWPYILVGLGVLFSLL